MQGGTHDMTSTPLAHPSMTSGSGEETLNDLGMEEYMDVSPRTAKARHDMKLKASEEKEEGVRWAKDAGFNPGQVEEFKQFLNYVETRFCDHSLIKDSKKLAEGSFGTIFKATYNGEKIAMKRIIKDASGAKSNPQRMREVLLEVSVNLKMDHPNVVKFLGTAAHFPRNSKTTEDGLFLGMIFEFCDKGTLYSLIFENKGHKIQPEAKLRVAKEIATGIRYIHSINIVHRDLSDRNVLYCSDGSVKLADFGCARKIQGNKYQPSTISGSPAFMAPEQLAGQQLSLKLDVWALGCLMWELFMEKSPWADVGRPVMGMAGLEVMKGLLCTQGKKLPQPPNSSFPTGFETDCRDCINSFLTKPVDQRPSAAEACEMLEIIWDKIKKSRSNPAEAANGGTGSKSVGKISPAALKALEIRLETFYKLHNSAKIQTVSQMARQFQADIPTLNQKLRDRYGVDLESLSVPVDTPKEAPREEPPVQKPQPQQLQEAPLQQYTKQYSNASNILSERPQAPPRLQTLRPEVAAPQESLVPQSCTSCPHRGAEGVSDGFHIISLCGGARYHGQVINGKCAGTGELFLADNTTFPVRFTDSSELQGVVMKLLEELAGGRAKLRQANSEGERERERANRLELTITQLRDELEDVRAGRRGVKDLSSKDYIIGSNGPENALKVRNSQMSHFQY